MGDGPPRVLRRPATDDDASWLRRCYVEDRSPEFAPLGLAPGALATLLDLQYAAQSRAYAELFPDAHRELVVVDGEAAGSVLIARGTDALRLVDVVLLGAARGRGIGTTLLGALQRDAAAAGLPLRLQVRIGNPAERLYARLGFAVVGADGLQREMEWRAPLQELNTAS